MTTCQQTPNPTLPPFHEKKNESGCLKNVYLCSVALQYICETVTIPPLHFMTHPSLHINQTVDDVVLACSHTVLRVVILLCCRTSISHSLYNPSKISPRRKITSITATANSLFQGRRRPQIRILNILKDNSIAPQSSTLYIYRVLLCAQHTF